MAVNLYAGKMTVRDAVEAAVLNELSENGIREGSLAIGSSKTQPQDCYVMLVAPAREPFSAVTRMLTMTSAETAAQFAKEFAHGWNMAR